MAVPNFQIANGGSYLRLGNIYILSGSAHPSEVPVHAPQGSIYARSGSAPGFFWNYTVSTSGSQWRSAASG